MKNVAEVKLTSQELLMLLNAMSAASRDEGFSHDWDTDRGPYKWAYNRLLAALESNTRAPLSPWGLEDCPHNFIRRTCTTCN